MSYNPLLPAGQATMAASNPVVIASNQTAVPVSGTFYQTTQPVSLASLPSLATGSNAIGSITNTSFASTQSGTWNITNISGTVSLPTGAATSAKQPALGTAGTASSDVLTVQGIASMTALKVDGSAVTQPVSGTVTANAGTGTMTVTVVSGATGGDSTFHLVSAATTNATNIKASAGKVTGWYVYNSNANARKVAFHNTAGTPTAGSSIHSSIVIPGLAAANVSFPDGIDFSTGIAITTVTDLTDAGSTAVALNDLIINIYYK
jgi:hypothetical protein